MSDIGISFKSTTFEEAWRLLARLRERRNGVDDFSGGGKSPALESPEEADAAHVIETLPGPAGMRSRRVVLDGRWWTHSGGPLVARVAERRRVPRGPTPFTSPSLAAGTGWVALIPHLGGYRMRATDTQTNEIHEWKVDAGLASRLAPFAFTFYRRFDPRNLNAADMLRFAPTHGGRDLMTLLMAGFIAALVGPFMPAATVGAIHHAIPPQPLRTPE